MLSSVGPCAVPRMLAILGLTLQRRSAAFAYIIGAGLGYASLALGLHFMQCVLASNDMILRLVAVASICVGLCGVLSGAPQNECANHQSYPISALALGFSTALVISPCCSPVLMMLAATNTQIESSFAQLAAFCCGQYIPIVFLALVGLPKYVSFDPQKMYAATHLFRSIMSLALGGYYALLAA
jgi:cytochrome c biogenesis protein CcdA